MSLVKELIKKYGNLFKAKVQEEINFNKKPIALTTLLVLSVAILDKLLAKLKSQILKEQTVDDDFDKFVNTYVSQNDNLSKLITYSSINLNDSIIDICNSTDTLTPVISSLSGNINLSGNDFLNLAENNTEIESDNSPLASELNNILTSIIAITPWLIMTYYLINKVKEALTQNDIPAKYRIKYLQALIKNTYKINKQNLLQKGKENKARIEDMLSSLKALDIILIASAIAYAVYKNNQTKLQESSNVSLTEFSCAPIADTSIVAVITKPFEITLTCPISLDDVPVPSLPFEEKLKNISCDVSIAPEALIEASVQEEISVNAIVENLTDQIFNISVNVGSYVDTNSLLGVNGSTLVYSPVQGYVNTIFPNKIYLGTVSDPPTDVITENALILNALYAEQNNIKSFLSNFFIKSWYPVMLKETLIRDVSTDSTIFDVQLIDPITGKPVETNFNLGKPDIVATYLFFQGGVQKRFDVIKKGAENAKKIYDKNVRDITSEDNVNTLAKAEQLDKILTDINTQDGVYYTTLINESKKGIIEARVTVPLINEYQLFDYYLNSIYLPLSIFQNPTATETSFKTMINQFVLNRFAIEKRKPENLQNTINSYGKELVSGFSINPFTNWFEEMLRVYKTQNNSIEKVKTYLTEQSKKNTKLTASEKAELISKMIAIFSFYLESASLNIQFKPEENEQTLTKTEGIKIDGFISSLILRFNALPEEIATQSAKLDDLQLFQTYSIVNETGVDYRYYAISKENICPAIDDEDPYLTPKTSNQNNMKYWVRYCSIATLTGAVNPTTWSTGIILPSGPLTLPVIYIPIKPLTTPWGFIVLGMSVCGIWPFPWILFVNYSANYNTPYPDPTSVIKKEIQSLKSTISDELKKFKQISLKAYLDKIKADIKLLEDNIVKTQDTITELKNNKPVRQRSADKKEDNEFLVIYVKDIETWTIALNTNRELLASQKLNKFKENVKFKGHATITFNNSFIVKNIKIIKHNNKLFLSMPSQRFRDGTFQDIAHPLNRETRKMIEDKILTKYFELINKHKTVRSDFDEWESSDFDQMLK